jgi:zinc protease
MPSNSDRFQFVDDAAIVLARHRRLPCGLDVLVHRDNSLPQVAVSMCYRAGSSDEVPGASGLAHLVEHLFKNSLHLGDRKHYEVLREIGASDANASTGSDRTEYHQVVPAEQLAAALWLESDRMGYFLPGLSQQRIDQQKSVVRSERRQRYENAAYGNERFAIAAALYDEHHPHRNLTIGLHHDIEQASYQSIGDFYRSYYPPANATLVVVGDIDDDTCDRLIDRYFATFPASHKPNRQWAASATSLPSDVVVDDQFAKLRRMHLVWRGPATGTVDGYALELLLSVLCQPGTGTLWRRLIYDELRAQRISGYVQLTRLGGEVHLVVDILPEQDVETISDIVSEVIAAATSDGVAPQRLAALQARRLASSMWSIQSLLHRATRLQHWSLYGDPCATFESQQKYIEQQQAMLNHDLIAAAKRWLKAPAVRVVTHPKKLG